MLIVQYIYIIYIYWIIIIFGVEIWYFLVDGFMNVFQPFQGMIILIIQKMTPKIPCRGGSSTKMFLRSTSSSCYLLMLNGFIEWIQLYDELFELMVYEETYKYVSLPTVLPHILPHAFTGGVFECVLPIRIGTMEEHSYLGSHQLKFRVYDQDPANYESAYLDPPSTYLNV